MLEEFPIHDLQIGGENNVCLPGLWWKLNNLYTYMQESLYVLLENKAQTSKILAKECPVHAETSN